MPAPSALRIGVPRHPGSDVLEGAVIGRRGAVVVDLRLDHRRVLGRLFGDHLAPWRVLGMEPLAAGECGVQLPDDRLAVTDERHLSRLVVADLLGRDVELDDLHVLGVARRLTEMEDPVEPGAHQEDDIGVLQCQGACGRPPTAGGSRA